MPADRYSPAALRAFQLVFEPWRRRRLEATTFVRLPRSMPADLPLLLVANHVSWWDGFVLLDLRDRIRGAAPFRVVMTEAELRRFPFFRRLGCLPVRVGSVSAMRRLVRTLAAVRERDPDSVFVWFPQGAIWPSFRRPLGFRRGVERIVEHLTPVAVLPVGIHCEPLNRRRPTFFVSVGEPLPAAEARSVRAIEAAVEAQLDHVHDHLARHGESAARDQPAAGQIMEAARAGAGGETAWSG